MKKSLAKAAFKKVKKQSDKQLRETAHRALQDWYRATYPLAKCESCGNLFNIMHHVVEKSQSKALWFDEDNLVHLCFGCHFRHHRTGDALVMGNIVARRGIAWFKRLKEKKRQTKQWTRKELEAVINRYSLALTE